MAASCGKCRLSAASLLHLILLTVMQQTKAMPPEWNLPSMPASWVLNSGGSHRCVTIPESVELCSNIGYTEMRLPNMLNHDTVQEVVEQTQPWLPLAKLACHREIRVLLCSVYAPVCIQQLPDKHIKPCRSLCEAVMRPCAAVMKNFGFSWPEMLNCTQFPDDTDLMCIKSSTDLPSKNASSAQCHSCPDKITYESIIGNYCVNKVVFKARIDSIAPAAGGRTQLRLKRRTRFFKSDGLPRQRRRQLRSVALDTGGDCTCRGLDAARAEPSKKFLMMGAAAADGSVTVSHLVEWRQRDRQFKRALRQIRAAKRRGGAAAGSVCRVARLPESLPTGRETERKKKKGKKGRKGRKGKKRRRSRKNRKQQQQQQQRRRRRRKNRDKSATEGGGGGGSGGGSDGGRGSRRQRRRDSGSSSGGSAGRPDYSYDSFYYRNYHTRAK